jgi:hypothetical protein
MRQGTNIRSAGGARDWRDAVATASGLNFLVGIWLMTAPYALAYDAGEPFWSDIVVGAVIAVLAFVRATVPRTTSTISYLNVLAGTWVFAASFWLYDSAWPAWNDLIAGSVVAILAVLSITASDDAGADTDGR